MIPEPNTKRNVSEEAELRRGWTQDGVSGPRRRGEGGLEVSYRGPRREVNCEIPNRLGRRMKHFFYNGVQTSPQQTCFKSFEGKPERKNPKRIISAP